MKEFEKIGDMLYKTEYIDHDSKKSLEIWNKIRNNKLLLKWAIKLTKNKFGQIDLVNSFSICDRILMDYEIIDKDIYNELIKLIYSNRQIARIVLNGTDNLGYTFLHMSLWNHELKLTNEQKAFAEKEAMSKICTKYCEHSDTPVHGVGDYDIRYRIMNNPNWTNEEKQKLVFDFWPNDEEYDELLERWEWEVINDAPYNSNGESLLDKLELNNYQYNDLINIFNNELITSKIWKDIQFCNLMHQLRPQQWEINHKIIKKNYKLQK